jgi:hypothetical protein
MLIKEAGFYEDIPSESYHLDPAPAPSLSSGGVKRLLDETPAHFRAHHPRLTPWPDLCETATKQQDLGSAVHKLVLDKGNEIAVLDFPDWRTNAAKAERERVRASNGIPILRHVMLQAQEIAENATEQLRRHFGSWPIGRSETAMFWERRTSFGTSVWCRALIDHLADDQHHQIDLKSTELSISDSQLAKKIASNGDDIQAAWYLDGYQTLRPESRGRAEFTFVVVEVSPPFAVRIFQLPNEWIHLATLRLDRATDLFAECLTKDEWPTYSTKARLEMPVWRRMQFESAELMEQL